MENNASFLLDPEYSSHFTGLMAFLEDSSTIETDLAVLREVFQGMYPVFLNLKALNAVPLHHIITWTNILDLETFLRNLHKYQPSLSKRIFLYLDTNRDFKVILEDSDEYLPTPKPNTQWSFDISIPRPLFDKDKGELDVSNLTEQALKDFLWNKEIAERIRLFCTPDPQCGPLQKGFVESHIIFDRESFMYEIDLYALYVNFVYPKNKRSVEDLSVDLKRPQNFFRKGFANSLQTQIKENQVSFAQEGHRLKILGLKAGVLYVKDNRFRF